MSFAICIVPVCPVRSEASHRSEQVSQLIFGEMCEILQNDKDFVRIKVLYDDYEGWCQSGQLEETGNEIISTNKTLAGEWVNKISIDDQPMQVSFGSSLDFLNNDNDTLKKHNIKNNSFTIHPGTNAISSDLVIKIANTFLNTPYQWGGRSVFGIDCSGFTQLVFKCLNIPLLRDAYQQATQGEEVEGLEKVQCGDLAFFENEAGRITHVGILINSNTIIHASVKVRVDNIDRSGIINKETGKRTHTLRIINRVINRMIKI